VLPLFSPTLPFITIFWIVHYNECSFLRWSFLISQLPLLTMLKNLPIMVECKWLISRSRHILVPLLCYAILQTSNSITKLAHYLIVNKYIKTTIYKIIESHIVVNCASTWRCISHFLQTNTPTPKKFLVGMISALK
jgi:hypothetical protein